jgi:chemotaxis response regulator CheB
MVFFDKTGYFKDMDKCSIELGQDPRKKVLVIQSDRIMGGVLLSLISHRDNLNVVSRSISSPLDLVEEVTRVKPEVIILDDQGQFACHADLQELLETIPDLKIIILGSNDNHVEVYSKVVFQISNASDFFQIL